MKSSHGKTSTALSNASLGSRYMKLKEWTDCREFKVFFNTLKTEPTKKAYLKSLRYFVECSQTTKTPITKLSQLPKMKKDKLEKLLEDWLISQQKKKRNTVITYLAGIEGFLDYNDADYNKKKMHKLIPAKSKLFGSKAYTLEQIQKIMKLANHPRTKAVCLLLASSGMRRGGLHDLKIKDMIPIENCYKFNTYNDSFEEYTTFCTPECREAIDQYIEHRKRKGEEITPESFVFVPYRKNGKRQVEYITSMINAIVNRTDIRGKKANRYEISTCHGFRKFGYTQLTNTNIHPNTIEKLVGHKVKDNSTNMDTYYDAEYKKLFEEYKKAIPHLTILEENRQKLIIKDLKSKSVGDEVVLTKELSDMKKQMKEIVQQMEDMKQQNEGNERLVTLYENNVKL